MPPTSRKSRGTISPATSLSQRAGQTNFSTAQRSRRKSNTIANTIAESSTNLVDSEEKTEEIERQLPISPDLPLRPPFLANKTPFGEIATGLQLQPPLHSSARPLFGLRTPANENSASTTIILGSSTLSSSGLLLSGVGNHFSVNKSKNGIGITSQEEQAEVVTRRTNILLRSSSLLKPTTSFHPPFFSNPQPVPPTSLTLQQQPLSSPPSTSLIHDDAARSHSQFGLGSPLVIRPRTKHSMYYRFCAFAFFVSVFLGFVFHTFELKKSGKNGYLESFLSNIPSLSNQIVKLLDIDNEPNVSISLMVPNQSQKRSDGVSQENKENERVTFNAAVDDDRPQILHPYSTYEPEVINMSIDGENSGSEQGNKVFFVAVTAKNSVMKDEEVLVQEISGNTSTKEPIISITKSSVLVVPNDISVDVNTNYLLLELQKVKDDLAEERKSRETMVKAMEAKIKASLEECEGFCDVRLANTSAVDSERLKSVSEAESIAKALTDVNEIKKKMSIQLKETVDLMNKMKQELKESAQHQLKLMSEMLSVAVTSSESANFAAINASEFAASSFTAAENATFAASNASLFASAAASAVTSVTMASTSEVNSQSLFDKSDSTVALSELHVAFSTLNATIYEDLNDALQRCEESTSIVNGVNSLAEPSHVIDFRLDGLLSLLKETRADLKIQAASLEELKVATASFLEDIGLLQKDRSDVDDLKTLVPSLSEKIDLNENKYKKFIIDLSELKNQHFALSKKVEEDEKVNNAHITMHDEMISSLSMKLEIDEKKVERTSSIVKEMTISMESILKRIKEYDEGFAALLELKSTVASLSMKLDETDSAVNDSVLEDLRTSFAALLKKFDGFEKIEEDNYADLAELYSSISTLKANVTYLRNVMATLPEVTSFNSSLLESAIFLNEVSIAQLRNESIWVEKRLREVIKSQNIHEAAVGESFLEVGDTLEFLTESLFNQSRNISYLFDLVRSHAVLNASSVDPILNYCDKSQTQKQQRADILLSDSLLLRVLRSASMPPFSPIYDASFSRNLVRHTWADGTSFDGIAALAVSNAPLTEYATFSDVAQLIDLSLAMFAADHGVPLPDYALAQGGAEVISHLTSSSWLHADAIGASEEAIEDLQLASSPYNALQPSVSEGAGHCWPMAGSSGHLTVRLKTPIRVTAITIDHLPPSVAPVRYIRTIDNATSMNIASQQRSTSALKRFLLYGLIGDSEEDEIKKMLLGSFEFDASKDAPPTQTFHLGKYNVIEGNGGEINKDLREIETATPIVMLQVLDNHGYPEYTCIYRFRVHGYVVQGK